MFLIWSRERPMFREMNSSSTPSLSKFLALSILVSIMPSAFPSKYMVSNPCPYFLIIRSTSLFFVCVCNISIISDISFSLKNLAKTLISHRIIFFLKSMSGILVSSIKKYLMLFNKLFYINNSYSFTFIHFKSKKLKIRKL